MTSPEKVAAEINNASSYLASQLSMGLDGFDPTQLKADLCNSLVSTIGAMDGPLSAASCTILSDAIRVTSFCQNEKLQLSFAVQKKLASCATQLALKPTDRQKFDTDTAILDYLTASDWGKVNDQSLPWDAPLKYMTAVQRLGKGGFGKPSETTVADLVTMVASSSWPQGDEASVYRNLYDQVQTVKVMWASTPVPEEAKSITVLKVFPIHPSKLPKDVYDAMYPDEPPCNGNIPLYATYRHLVSCRGSNKHVRESLGYCSKSRDALPAPSSHHTAMVPFSAGGYIPQPIPQIPLRGSQMQPAPQAVARLMQAAQGMGMDAIDAWEWASAMPCLQHHREPAITLLGKGQAAGLASPKPSSSTPMTLAQRSDVDSSKATAPASDVGALAGLCEFAPQPRKSEQKAVGEAAAKQKVEEMEAAHVAILEKKQSKNCCCCRSSG